MWTKLSSSPKFILARFCFTSISTTYGCKRMLNISNPVRGIWIYFLEFSTITKHIRRGLLSREYPVVYQVGYVIMICEIMKLRIDWLGASANCRSLICLLHFKLVLFLVFCRCSRYSMTSAISKTSISSSRWKQRTEWSLMVTRLHSCFLTFAFSFFLTAAANDRNKMAASNLAFLFHYRKTSNG